MRRWICALLVLAGASAARADAPAGFDPRLGAPFAVRERPSVGSEQAPVTVVEAGSPACGHCQAFHRRVFPELRDRYIAPGRVRWVTVGESGSAEDAAEYRRLEIKSTPTFFIIKVRPDGRLVKVRLDGYQTLDYFERVLDELLKSP